MGVATAQRTAFCTRCGASLVDGACPERHDRRVLPVRPVWALALAAAIGLVLVGALLTEVRSTGREQRRLRKQVAASTVTATALSERMKAIESRAADQLDVAAVAKKVEPAVFTIEDSGGGIGSGFALRFAAPNTEIVTNFHVVEEDWKKGKKDVTVRQHERSMRGRVVNVNPSVDVAVIHVAEMLPVLQRAPGLPAVGDPVIVVGAPLRLDSTVSTGIVSALRDEFLQFSAPVSPGNSGGPVVDRTGRVIGVTRAKEAGIGVEGLSFAIPIAVVCSSLGIC